MVGWPSSTSRSARDELAGHDPPTRVIPFSRRKGEGDLPQELPGPREASFFVRLGNRRIPARLAGIGGITGLAFAAVFSTFAMYLRIFGDPHFWWDAQQYWDLAAAYGPPGHFSLLHYDNPVRGYSLPLLNRGLATIATHTGMGNVTVVQLFGSLEAALLGTVLVPRLVKAVWSEARVTLVRVLLFNALVFLFWRDHFGFPLSDFPAATLAIGALLALTRRSFAGYAIAGLAIGLAWNVRPAYLIAMISAVVLAAFLAGIRRRPLAAAAAAALVLAGIVLVSLPQIMINKRHFDSWSPTVSAAKDLNMAQLTFGLNVQRIETNVGTTYPSSSMIYYDPSTRKILEREHITALTSYGQYLQLIPGYPAEMVGAWSRRFFNGLDVRYATVYIHDLHATGEWFSLVNYSVIFLALVRVLLPPFRRRLGRVAWAFPSILLAAAVPAVPFAMEPRYFIPIQLVIYAIVVFGRGARQALAELGRSDRMGLAVAYAAFLLLCVTLSASTIALIAFPT
jgi:hypothetical protein